MPNTDQIIEEKVAAPKVEPTPLVHIDGILAKLECVNPTGSIKDRIAQYILRRSHELGLLKPGMRIVEATSGNTGIAFAYHGRQMGFPVTIIMPKHMSQERIAIIRALGAELILCSEEGGFAEAAQIRNDLVASDPTAFNPDQFSNPLNVECHAKTTGVELIEQAGTKIDAFVAGVGTGGTLIGVGQALRNEWPDTVIVAVEPAEAAVMSGGLAGTHSIFGIGDGFIPCIAGNERGGIHDMIDEVAMVSSAEALEAARYLQLEHHLCVGTSSGANYLVAKRLLERYQTVATVFADGALKYISSGLHSCEPGECQYSERCRHSVLSTLSTSS